MWRKQNYVYSLVSVVVRELYDAFFVCLRVLKWGSEDCREKTLYKKTNESVDAEKGCIISRAQNYELL